MKWTDKTRKLCRAAVRRVSRERWNIGQATYADNFWNPRLAPLYQEILDAKEPLPVDYIETRARRLLGDEWTEPERLILWNKEAGPLTELPAEEP